MTQDAEEEMENAGVSGDQTTDDMSDGGVDDNDDEGLGIKKLVLFVVLPIFLLGGAGGAAYFMGVFGGEKAELKCENVVEGDPDYVQCEAKRIAEEEKIGVSSEPGAFYEIPNLIVNLNSTGRQPRFLKISVQLELADELDLPKLEKIAPRVIDHFQTYLRELRVEDLRGSAGIYRLRMELLSRVNAAAPDIDVRDVLFQEILIQ